MEKVRGWRVINNDAIFKVSIKPREIFYKYSVEESTVFSEESVSTNLMLIKEIKYRICILTQRSCVDNDFVTFTHSFHKLVYSWSFLHKNVANLAVYFYLNFKVRVLNWSK